MGREGGRREVGGGGGNLQVVKLERSITAGAFVSDAFQSGLFVHGSRENSP